MKKFLLSFLLAFLALTQLNGNHFTGGGLTWECLGNGDYIFTLNVYRDCNGINLPPTYNIVNDAGLGNIKCYLESTEDISVPCYDPLQSISCNRAQAPGPYLGGAIAKFTYISDTVEIDTIPPPGGFRFYFKELGRNTVINIAYSPLFYVESRLYATSANGGCLASSPKFLHNPPTYFFGEGSHSHIASTPGLDDSLYYRLVPMLTMDTSFVKNVSYTSGYSYLAPLPDPSEHSSNGPNVFDQENGQLHYGVFNATFGIYNYAVMVESWYNNTLMSTITREFMSIYDPGQPANNSPGVDIDTAQYSVEKKNSNVYYINTFPGDTVDFVINSNDADILPNGNPQSIKFESFSKLLDSTMGQFASIPQITPVSPQSGFISTVNNNVNFSWYIDPSLQTVDYPVYTFLFRFTDDACSFPGRTDIIVKIKVHSPASIANDTLNVCEGDSLQLDGTTASGNYLWSPNLEISDVNLSQPSVSPSSSRYYYLTDPQNPGFKDSVYVDVESRGSLHLQHSNGVMYTSGTAVINNNIWYYNHIPFLMNKDSIQIFGPGEYYMQALGVICHYWSDTVNIQGVSNLVNIYPQNGNLAPQQIPLDSSIGFNFQLTQNFEGELDSLYLLGVSTGKLKMQGDSLTVKLYESVSQTEIFSYSRLLNNPLGEIVSIPVGVQLKENVPYTLALSGDTGIYIYTYENVNYPSFPYNGNLQVNGALKGESLQYPSTSSNYLPAVVLAMENSFSLKDLELNTMQLYPNPGGNRIFISGLKENENYKAEIVDIRGKIIKQMELNDSGMDIRSLAPGFYILQFTVDGNGIRYSFVKE